MPRLETYEKLRTCTRNLYPPSILSLRYSFSMGVFRLLIILPLSMRLEVLLGHQSSMESNAIWKITYPIRI